MKLVLGNIVLEFDSALTSVPSNGADWDWVVDSWDEVVQDIKIEQQDGFATIHGLTGNGPGKGENRVSVLLPEIKSEQDVFRYYENKLSGRHVEKSQINDAISTEEYSWGKVIALSWHRMGFAPGGTEYCMLPHEGPVISTGFIKLNWISVKIYSLL